MSFNLNPVSAYTIVVKRMFIQETGTYNNMFNRPYAVNTSGGVLESAIDRLNQHPGSFHGPALSGIGSLLLRPVANVTVGVDDIYIPNGWKHRRLRFLLEVETTARTGAVSIYYFQGFTDDVGVSHAGSIDPRMPFYINSLIRVGRFHVNSPTGIQTKDVVQESAQVLNGQLLYQNVNNQEVMRMRPCDIAAGIQTSHIRNVSYGDVIDTRVITARGTDSFGSQRANNLPTNYMASFMTNYRDATSLVAVGQGSDNILSRAQSSMMATEHMPEENPVLRALANIQGGKQTVQFSMADLAQLDPQTPTRTVYNQISQIQLASLHSTGRSEDWSSSATETEFAAQLMNSVPALMMEHFITTLHFTASNMMGMNLSICQETFAMALTGADMSGHISSLMSRIKNEILYDLSWANQIPYDLTMKVDTFGETEIMIGTNGNAPIPYVVPSFGDGLLAPIYSRGEKRYNAMTNDMEMITNHIREAVNANAPGGSQLNFSM